MKTIKNKAQQEFLTRGRTSLAKAMLSDEFYPLREVLDRMSARMSLRLDEARRERRPPAKKP